MKKLTWLKKPEPVRNGEAREWRHDSDKKTGMVDDFDDFFKGKSGCS